MHLRPLPEAASALLRRLDAPPRLVAHLTLTHDVAARLIDRFTQQWPALSFDRELVLFGAAIHDVGKTHCRSELSAAGKAHEDVGERLLVDLGVPPQQARFCRTHGRWDETSPLEDLLVALADTIWKAKRDGRLEEALTSRITGLTGDDAWRVYLALDDLLDGLARDAEARLAWQAAHPVDETPGPQS